MALRPLHKFILFAFTDDAAGGKFIPKTASGIILTNQSPEFSQGPKWGKVLAVGDECEEVKVGDYILIEALQWTTGFTHDEIKVWRTTEEKVIAVSEDINSTRQY